MPHSNRPLLPRRLLIPVCLFAVLSATLHASGASSSVSTLVTFAAERWSPTSRGSIDDHVFQLAMRASACAVTSGAVTDARTLTVIDYSRPSTDQRLWVYDLVTGELLYEELVAHGQGSGDNMASTFSNLPNTHASSLGLFTTHETYVGRNGYSLRLNGLDDGFNDRARERAIVMHGASYVSAAFVKAQGRLGRSWGCPALRSEIAHELIERIKGTGLLFAYYPDTEWLGSSKFLNGCGAA